MSDAYKGSTSPTVMMYEWDYDTYSEAQNMAAFLTDIRDAQEADHKQKENVKQAIQSVGMHQ